MQLVKLTLLVAFLAMLSFSSAITKPPKNWPKSYKCAAVCLEGVSIFLNNAVRLGKKLIDCVDYTLPPSDGPGPPSTYRDLRIVYEFAKKLFTEELVCLAVNVIENQELLDPVVKEFDALKCIVA